MADWSQAVQLKGHGDVFALDAICCPCLCLNGGLQPVSVGCVFDKASLVFGRVSLLLSPSVLEHHSDLTRLLVFGAISATVHCPDTAVTRPSSKASGDSARVLSNLVKLTSACLPLMVPAWCSMPCSMSTVTETQSALFIGRVIRSKSARHQLLSAPFGTF